MSACALRSGFAWLQDERAVCSRTPGATAKTARLCVYLKERKYGRATALNLRMTQERERCWTGRPRPRHRTRMHPAIASTLHTLREAAPNTQAMAYATKGPALWLHRKAPGQRLEVGRGAKPIAHSVRVAAVADSAMTALTGLSVTSPTPLAMRWSTMFVSSASSCRTARISTKRKPYRHRGRGREPYPCGQRQQHAARSITMQAGTLTSSWSSPHQSGGRSAADLLSPRCALRRTPRCMLPSAIRSSRSHLARAQRAFLRISS